MSFTTLGEPFRPRVGDFVEETLVTDTRVYEVIRATAKTLTLRPVLEDGVVRAENRDGNPFPVVFRKAVADPDAPTFTVRMRQDGTYRIASWASALRPATMINGQPVTFTDYRQ